LLPLIDPVPIENLITAAKQKWALGEKKVRQFIEVLVDQKKVFIHEFPRPRTNPKKKYAQTPQS
jgi:hypothetical protein